MEKRQRRGLFRVSFFFAHMFCCALSLNQWIRSEPVL